MSNRFDGQTWPDIKKSIKSGAILLLPLGQTEEHGVHLQVGTDTIIAQRIVDAVADRLKDELALLVLPAIPYGYVPNSALKWPGTFRIRQQVMIDYLSDVCCSAVKMGFKKLAIVSTHGPHAEIAKLAAREVFDQTGIGIVVTFPHVFASGTFKKIRKSEIGGACHACEYETSLMLHFGYPVDLSKTDDRDRVRMCNEWVAGDMVNGSGKVFWSTWSLQDSESGAYGDPSCASAEIGRQCFDAIVEEYCRFLRFYKEQEVRAHT